MTLGDGKRSHLSPQMNPCRYPAFRLSTNLEPVSTKLQSRVEPPSSSCQCMLSNMNMADSMEPPATTSPAPAAMAIKRIRQACTTCRQKKVKCSGDRPRCVNCRRAMQRCQYEPYSVASASLSRNSAAALLGLTNDVISQMRF
ncbi:Fungal specific transcription factor domain-containing protein [Colletotrichum higginsianum IMI 349063]|uniref:Fungal specific transcription factor domain-containing protein n=1 Tax=Colletotrichum higginsianum (strain IMI 349063) TaxID=759273 RepID=A0A1B7YDV6_COLHI|nr:Fungal specific transcription factor domain-containing protein [Colletotrichum higginsianum IMI 349063]OBR10199.1 Fungal specific transcription factor domain-containing protein [Colletotrichum higginsianum IMI 349063]